MGSKELRAGLITAGTELGGEMKSSSDEQSTVMLGNCWPECLPRLLYDQPSHEDMMMMMIAGRVKVIQTPF